MYFGILPFAILLGLVAIAVMVWAVLGVVRVYRQDRRLSAVHAVVLMVFCAGVWLVLSFFFMILASLGHSTHALRDALPGCLVSFLILVVVPAVGLRIIHLKATRRATAEKAP
jgi:hypothetical protein